MRVAERSRLSQYRLVSICLFLLAAFCAAGWRSLILAAPQGWEAVRRAPAASDPSGQPFELLNPDHNLRAFFDPDGARFFPYKAEAPVWWLRLAPLTGGIAQRFDNGPEGISHTIEVASPGTLELVWELQSGGDAEPRTGSDGRSIDLAIDAGETVLRYEVQEAVAADGAALAVEVSLKKDVPGTSGSGLRLHMNIEAAGAAWPIKLTGRLSHPAAPGASPQPVLTAGTPWSGEEGIDETLDDLMLRAAAAPAQPAMISDALPMRPATPGPRGDAVASPEIARWPPFEPPAAAAAPVSALAPQVPGVSFEATNMNESGGFVPADATADISSTQILIGVNKRLKVFDRTGALGGLNLSTEAFFVSVRANQPVSNPQVRYDRLSGRWFVIAITTTAPNRIVMAVSSGSIISSPSSFTFFFFQHDLVSPAGDTGGFADAPSLGVDRLALYIGTNTFNAARTTYMGSAGFVVRKSALLAGSLVVSAFRGLNTGGLSSGPYAPRGVDNDDPAATEGYFIGSDNGVFGRLTLRRVSDPGGTPSISSNINVTVPATSFPMSVPHAGSQRPLEALDDRLFAARIHRNKITGTLSLWTAHNIEVNTAGVAAAGGGRTAARWYELGNLGGAPVLLQAGTLFDAAAAPRSFWIPSVAMSGQGHAALGCSTAGAAFRVDGASAGRLAGDPPGSIQSPTTITSSTTAYNADLATPQRWGSYSATMLDPLDDMTLWTIQEYCSAINVWGVRVVQLIAPPPPVLSTASPATVCQGRTGIEVAVGGNAPPGSGFFDPGSDTGGPGYAGHLSAMIVGGPTVSSTRFDSPSQVTLTLSTVGSPPGPKHVIVTNPDGQSGFGSDLLTVITSPVILASSTGPVCEGSTVQLSATPFPGAAYSWTGPGGFVSTDQNPVISGAPASASGLYTVTVTAPGCLPVLASTTAVVIASGLSCVDADACTQTDICLAGACVGSNPVTCAASDDCHLAGSCDPGTGLCSNPVKPDGSSCSDANSCTRTDVCQSGTCTGTRPVNCFAIDQCHGVGTCEPATGLCSNPPLPDGEVCDDADNCTQVDECRSGTCQGFSPVVCAPQGQCSSGGVCDPGTGLCTNTTLPDGSPCSDANACTQADRCQNGFCVAGPPVTCTALDQCHVAGVCNPGTGVCGNPERPNGSACSDANACTQTDTCQSGSCIGGAPVTCAASDQCHDPGICNPGTGVCSNPIRPNGSTCSDANACTQTDTCQSGSCVGVAPVTCAASDQCHDPGVCNPGTGVCSNPERPNGSACSDANACTQTDTCQSGSCIGGAPVTCAASDQCHDPGVCNPGTGVCSNPERPNGSACSDANGCTQADTCQSGLCVAGPPVTCAPQGQCSSGGVCDPGTGLCTNTTLPDGSPCSDSNGCTQTDTCQNGFCVAGPPVTCTAPSQCHEPGVCDPGTGACSSLPRPNGFGCNDGNACTQTDTCQSGACTGANPVICRALDFCHLVGTCNSATGVCSNPIRPNGNSCTDLNSCTRPDRCQDGVCVPGPPRDDDLDGHADPVCGGDDCNEANNQVWAAASEVTNLNVTAGDPANPTWDSQSVLSGPGTQYDLVSGAIGTLAPGVVLSGATCLQSSAGTTYSDARAVPPGSVAFWYLVRARNACGTGTYGTPQRNSSIPVCP